MKRLPKREARRQLLDALFAGIYFIAVIIAASVVLHRKYGHQHYDARGYGYILAFIFGLPAALIVQWRASRRAARVEFRRKNGMCVNCGYDLRGNTTSVCPECGEPVEKIETPENEKPAPQDQGHRITPRSGK